VSLRKFILGIYRKNVHMSRIKRNWKLIKTYSKDIESKMAGNFSLTGLRPVKLCVNGHVVNKAGRLVLRGQIRDKEVKVYEAANLEHAVFIKELSQQPDIRIFFPEVLGLHGRFVICQWVKGSLVNEPLIRKSIFGKLQMLQRQSLEDLSLLQSRIHKVRIDSLPEPHFDYWQDFIWPRFSRAAELLNESVLANEIRQKVQNEGYEKSRILIHPDLTPANVIRTPDNHLKIIDNELMTIGSNPLLDMCNTANSLGDKYRRYYMELYLRETNMTPTEDEIDILQATWLARRVGAAFVAGKLPIAFEILMRYKNRENILPVDLSSLI